MRAREQGWAAAESPHRRRLPGPLARHPQEPRHPHRLAGRAGIDKRVHPHGLRRTYAAELEAGGLTVSEISRLLGHSSAAVTVRYLDHLTNDRAITALEGAELPELDDTPPPRRRRAA